MNNKDNTIPKEDVIPQMETGELELRKAFEDVTTKNVRMVVDFSQETRKLVRDLHHQVKQLSKLIMAKDTDIKQLKKQVAGLQQRLYAKGS